MLSSKGNENGEKTTIGLISKKATLQHTFLICTFLCHCFAQLQRETSRNFLVTYFMKEISYVILHTFFFTATHFHLWPLAFLIFSMPLQIFHVVLQQRMSPLFFISLQLSFTLFPIELHWTIKAYMYFLFFSVFLLFCIPNCGHDNNINLQA